MNKKRSLVTLIMGVGFLVSNLWNYLDRPSDYFYFVLSFVFLMIIIGSIFELKKITNKKFFLILMFILFSVMWILSFIIPFSPSIEIIFIYNGLATLFISILIVLLFKEWDNY
jgi:hypothetical protein